MENNENKVAEVKAEVIRKIAGSKHFIVITDNGNPDKNLDTMMMLNSPITALEFLKLLKNVEDIILRRNTPPPSSIIK